MSVTCYDEPLDQKVIYHNLEKVLKLLPKFSYCVEECFGDYYYKQISLEETVKKAMSENNSLDTRCNTPEDLQNYI